MDSICDGEDDDGYFDGGWMDVPASQSSLSIVAEMTTKQSFRDFSHNFHIMSMVETRWCCVFAHVPACPVFASPPSHAVIAMRRFFRS